MLKIILFVFLLLANQGFSQGLEISDEDKIYTSLEEASKTPDKVYKLELIKKRLTAFPIEVFAFKNLRSLNLSANKLLHIPADVEKLEQLEELDISKNELLDLPPEIGNLKNLKQLVLYKNDIDSIPPEIGNLKNLERLDLWENDLSGIPQEMENLKRLKVLELRGILFSDKQQKYIQDLLPETTIFFSPSCNTCKD